MTFCLIMFSTEPFGYLRTTAAAENSRWFA